MTDKVLIGVLGKSGAGKDEFCKAILSRYGSEYQIERIALADAVKAEVDYIGPFAMCIDYNVPYDENAPKNDPLCSTEHGKQRQLLQFWGQYRRQSDLFYWVKKLDQRICQSPARIVIVSDVRYTNERFYIKRTGFTVRINREGHVGLTGEAAAHVSENELNNYKADYVINVGQDDLHTLHQESIKVFDQITASFELESLTDEELYDDD